jgi:hypothetical protein
MPDEIRPGETSEEHKPTIVRWGKAAQPPDREPLPAMPTAKTRRLPENQAHQTRRLPDHQFFRRRVRPVLRLVLVFFIGFLLGILILSLFLFSLGGSNTPLPTSSPDKSSGNVIVHVDSTILVPLIDNGWQQSNIPGSISQVQVQFTAGDLMTITGKYQYTVFGIIPITEPFSVQIQPVAQNCYPQFHVVKGSISGISITSFIASFQNTINQQLQQTVKSMPVKFTYCLISLHTDSSGLIAALEVSHLAFSGREVSKQAIWWASV